MSQAVSIISNSNLERLKNMKKIYSAMAAMLAVALTSCQKEEQALMNEEFSPNTVVFGVGRTAGTKAAGPAVISRQNISSIDNKEVDGLKLFLEETVTLLDATPATKGTPAYTENVGTLYGNKLGVYSPDSNFGDATYEKMDNALKDGGWRYQHNYASNPWPADEDDAVDFYFRMPSDMSGIGEDGFKYGTGFTGGAAGKISFSYTSPGSAAEQQDILFGYRSASKSDYQTSLPNGIPVLLNHALTGVKFALADDIKSTIMIDSVAFTGLIDNGTCVVTPASEDNYVDNITNFSSSASGVVVWTDTTRTGVSMSANYSDTVSYAKNTAGSFDSAGDYPKSFANGGNKNNLDDADGNAAQTFWLIPQKLAANAKLTIRYVVKATPDATTGTSYTFTIDFGKTLKDKSVEWKAGELHTYTIRVDDVNVKIEDAVTITSGQTASYTDDHGDTHTIYGGTKNGITITNTGNTDAFIRAAITGQWVDEDGAPVFSFTDFTVEDIILEIASWYNDQFGTGNGHFGVFDGLVGYTKNGKDGTGNAGWVKGNDGYYYYTTKVAPNATTGTALFNSYTVTLANVPKIKVAGALQEVHFVMEISTQAISAKKLDGSDYAWNKAWENALGSDPSAN